MIIARFRQRIVLHLINSLLLEFLAYVPHV